MIKKGKKQKQGKKDLNQEEALQSELHMPNLTCPKQFFKLPKNSGSSQIEDQVKKLVSLVNRNVQVWEQNNQFVFQLPESQFDVTRQTPVINYVDQEAVVDNVEPGPLSDAQKKSMYETGTFIVNSKRYSIPYKWLVNKLLYFGKKERRQLFLDILSGGFNELYKIKMNIFGNESQSRSLANVKKVFKDLFNDLIDIFIGRPYVNSAARMDPYEVVETQRQIDIKNKYWESINKSLNFLYSNIQSQQKGEKQKLEDQLAIVQINRIQNQFRFQWERIEPDILQKLEQQIENEDELEQRLIEQKYKIIMKIESDLKPELLEQLHFLLDQQRIINKAFRKMNLDNQKARQQIEKQLKSHEVKSRCLKWYNEQLSTRFSIVEKQNYNNTLQYLRTQLKTPFFSDYIECCKTYTQRQNKIRSQNMIHTPFRIYNSQYVLDFPRTFQSYGLYHLKMYETYTYDTGSYGWMFKNSVFVAKAVFNECVNVGMYGISRGPFSFRYLISFNSYGTQKIINQSTGQISYAISPQIEPLVCQVKNKIKQIKAKREEFQKSPDTGFMKKSYLRVFNIIYCYIFLGLVKLFSFHLIVKPLFCIVCITCSVCMLTFSWLFAIGAVIADYLWSVFIYKYNIGDYINYSKSSFPLLQVTFKTIWNTWRVVWIILLAIFFHPLFSILHFLFAIIYLCSTTIYYQFVFLIIKVVARSPTSDSAIAWRIEGPGVSKNFSQKLNADDIYILFLSECQKIELGRYQQLVLKKLNSIITHNQSLISPIQLSFQLSSNVHNRFQQSINFYTNKINNQFTQRMKVYPILHNSVVRFTQQQLNEYTGNCIEMVQFFMNTHKFADFYTFFNIDKKATDKTKQLVVAIWQRIFGNRKVFEAYKSDLERYRVIENQRDQEETDNVMKQINTQHQFRKGGYRKFKYEKPQDKTTVIVPKPQFAPITTLVNELRQITYKLLSSKDHPELAVLICPDIEILRLKLNDLKV